MTPSDEKAFFETALANPINAAILNRLGATGLPDVWLVGGCIFQTVWNINAGLPPEQDIKDYDIFYCDATDLSWEAEDRAIAKTKALMADLNVTIEVKNQARVHLWYAQKFGQGYPRLQSSQDGIDRFLVAGTCLGMQRRDGAYTGYASFGVQDMIDGLLRINPRNARPALFAAKAASYQKRWPGLTMVEDMQARDADSVSPDESDTFG